MGGEPKLNYKLLDKDQQQVITKVYDEKFAKTTSPDVCRNKTVDVEYNGAGLYFSGWFKATTATSTPHEAALFLHKHVGGTRVQSPYMVDTPECHYAEWVAFHNTTRNERPFMFHFVRSPKTFQDGKGKKPTVKQLADDVAAHRDLVGNAFDHLLFMSIVVNTADLAPHIKSLEADDVPYLLRKDDKSGHTSLFVTIPGSSTALQLVSSKAPSSPKAKAFDMCEA